MVWSNGLERSGSVYEQVACSCKCGNEPSGFMNSRNFSTSISPIRFWCRTVLDEDRKEDKNFPKNQRRRTYRSLLWSFEIKFLFDNANLHKHTLLPPTRPAKIQWSKLFHYHLDVTVVAEPSLKNLLNWHDMSHLCIT